MEKWKGTDGDRWMPLPEMLVSDGDTLEQDEQEEMRGEAPIPSASTHNGVLDATGTLQVFPVGLPPDIRFPAQIQPGQNARDDALARAIAEEEARAAEEEGTARTGGWKKTAQFLMTAKTEVEGELVEVRHLADHRLREKDRIIGGLEAESGQVRAALQTLTEELKKAKEEVKLAKETERRHEQRMKALEGKMEGIMKALEKQGTCPQPPACGRSSPSALMAETHTMSPAALCLRAVEDKVFSARSPTGGGFTYELDDNVPPSPVLHRQRQQQQQQQQVLQRNWPNEDPAVVDSLAQLIRTSRHFG